MTLWLTALLPLTALLLAGAPSIRLANGAFVVEGCDSAAPSVYVDSLADAPPVAGSLSKSGDAVVFKPRYPPSPGVTYRAECGGEAARLTIPAPDRTPTTSIDAVYPSTDELPENLLKFYIHFTAPMSRGEVYDRVRLLGEDGEPIELAFLEIDEELWDARYERLTLLFDPGRIKTGLVPNQEVGVALEAGRGYTLRIDGGWPDADGKPLTGGRLKRFRVVEADTTPPDPETWTLTAPSGAREPLTLDFPEPLDQALLSRVVRVVTATGARVQGEARVGRGETRWSFTPNAPWAPGRYRVEAETILEDLAGNSLNRPFEVDVFEKVEDRVARVTASIPFEIKP